jgi:hypothetical protein
MDPPPTAATQVTIITRVYRRHHRPSHSIRAHSIRLRAPLAMFILAQVRRSLSVQSCDRAETDAIHTSVMSQHRSSVHIVIRLSDHPSLKRCVDDSNYRVMVFCAGDNTGTQDISFPHQSELKVNGGDIKANLRGLKNKPGSTRPVDITSSLRLKSSYTNNIEFTYALTQKASLLDVVFVNLHLRLGTHALFFQHYANSTIEILPHRLCMQGCTSSGTC